MIVVLRSDVTQEQIDHIIDQRELFAVKGVDRNRPIQTFALQILAGFADISGIDVKAVNTETVICPEFTGQPPVTTADMHDQPALNPGFGDNITPPSSLNARRQHDKDDRCD